MKEKLLQCINELKSDGRLISYDEATTKQIIILRVLKLLGWNTYRPDEVAPEYSVGGKKVDYSLRVTNANKVFLEIKRIREDLNGHQKQLLNYSFQEGVQLAILSNGVTWWFYLPLLEGSWEQRKFYTIEIYDQSAEHVADKFIEYLAKDNIVSGRSFEEAKKVFRSRQKRELVNSTLPEAWNKIISEPDELLIELISEKTEKLCGYRPEASMVESLILNNIQPLNIGSGHIKEEVLNNQRIHVEKKVTNVNERNFTNKKPTSFSLNGKSYPVKHWKEFLIKLCQIMSNAHKGNFGDVLNLKGRQRPYFSQNADELRIPEQIKGTDIYVEINLSANQIVRISNNVIALFGYSNDTFEVFYN